MAKTKKNANTDRLFKLQEELRSLVAKVTAVRATPDLAGEAGLERAMAVTGPVAAWADDTRRHLDAALRSLEQASFTFGYYHVAQRTALGL